MSISSSVKNRLIKIGILVVGILVVIFVLNKIKCGPNDIGSWFGPWHIPTWAPHADIKPDTLLIKPHDPDNPGVIIGGGVITPHGDFQVSVVNGDLDYILNYHTSMYHGAGVITTEGGNLKISFPVFGIEPTLTGGVSLPEFGGLVGLQTVYINNFLWTGRALHAPVIKGGYIHDVRIGLGTDFDIAQGIGIGGSYLWRIRPNDQTLLEIGDPNIYADLHVDIWTF
jgi:hypothetical protein